MSPEWVAILALIALFVVGTVLPINMGALAFVAAYLFTVAKNNGTVDLIVRAALRGVGGRVALSPG